MCPLPIAPVQIQSLHRSSATHRRLPLGSDVAPRKAITSDKIGGIREASEFFLHRLRED